MNQPRIRKMTLRIFSICLLSSTTIYSAKNSNVPPLQYLVVNNLVKNKVPLETAAPALNNTIHLKDPYSKNSAQLGEWLDVKKINEKYENLKNDICNGKKSLNTQNARRIFYPGGPWDSEDNKIYKKCLDCCICLGYGESPKNREDYPPHTESVVCCCTLLCAEQILFYNNILSHPLASHLLCITLSPLTYPLCAATLVACLHFHYYQEQKTILKAIVDPKTWEPSTAPQSLTMSEDENSSGSSNFAASSNMLNVALKMKED